MLLIRLAFFFFFIFASERSANYILIPAVENDVPVIAENFTLKTTQKHRNWEADFHCHTASNITGILKPLLLNCSQLSRAPTAILGFTASFNFPITHSISYCTKKNFMMKVQRRKKCHSKLHPEDRYQSRKTGSSEFSKIFQWHRLTNVRNILIPITSESLGIFLHSSADLEKQTLSQMSVQN